MGDSRGADFRHVSPAALTWFPQSRRVVPVTPVRVQVPPSACAIALLPGRYGVELTLAGHAAHPAFVRFLAEVEAHAREHARPADPSLRWFPCADADALVPKLRVSAFDDTKFFGADGLPSTDPTGFAACSCLLELTGAWTADAAWGLRWRVLEVKDAGAPPALPALFVDDDAPPPAVQPMFLADDDA